MIFVRRQFDFNLSDKDALTSLVTVETRKILFIAKFYKFLYPDPPSAMQDRMIQACNAAFTASLAYELNRLYTELHSIDPELAAQLREKSAHCFSQAPTREYFINVLNNIL